MRQAVVDELLRLALHDPRVVLLTGDLGWSVLERFAERLPGRFVNCGVAEANMVGVATGLAEAGYRPYVYSIAPFAALRPYEQLRDGPALMRLPVRVLGVGGGLDYGPAGATHHAWDDLGAMALLPGMAVLAPADAPQAVAALRAVHALPGPAYVRVGKDDRPDVPGLDGRLRLGRVEVARAGGGLLLLATGAAAGAASAAADLLADEGRAPTVAIAACLAPAPRDDLRDLLRTHACVVRVEEHARVGGLFALAADVVATDGLPARLTPCVLHPERLGPVGGAPALRARHGLDAVGIAAAARAALAPRP